MGRAWKSAEKEVAEFFGVKRRIRVSYDESVGDTTAHPVFSIEIKYGGQVPKYLSHKTPKIIIYGDRVFKSCPSEYWDDFEWREAGFVIRKDIKFLSDALDQAKTYNPTKIPLVCVKPRNRKGFIIIVEVVNGSDTFN